MKMKMKTRHALTLIEILVVVAIILIVAGILFPVISNARYRAFVADDMAKLRQIGIANTIYEDTYGIAPYRLQPLVENAYLDPEMVASRHDSSDIGLAILALAKEPEQMPWQGPKVSFVPISINQPLPCISRFLLERERENNSGWLISLVDYDIMYIDESLDEKVRTLILASGRYLRLRLDTSVIHRKGPYLSTVMSGQPPAPVSIGLHHYVDNLPEPLYPWTERLLQEAAGPCEANPEEGSGSW